MNTMRRGTGFCALFLAGLLSVLAGCNTSSDDTLPDIFVFTSQTGVPTSTPISSNTVTIDGISKSVRISVGGDPSSLYRINGGVFTAVDGTVSAGDTVQVRHTSAPTFDTTVVTEVHIGRLNTNFTSTTTGDINPNPFSFTAQTGVDLSSTRTSNTVAITGISSPAPISVSGGTYSIGCGAFTSAPGTITNGQTVCVQHISASTVSTATSTTLTIGNQSATFTSTTAATADTTPNTFSFTDVSGVPTGSLQTSNSVTISGINAPTSIIVAGGSYSINGGAFTSANGTVANGQTVRVQHTASANANTATDTTLTVGSVFDTFTSTTAAAGADTIPDQFTFVDVTGVPTGSTQTSNQVTIAGINAPASISVTGGSYNINGGAFTAAAGTVTSGQSVRVQHTASATAGTAANTTLTVGGVSDTFTSTTAGGASTAFSGKVYAVTAGVAPKLLSFQSATPGTIVQGNGSGATITGLGGQSVLSADFRPADNTNIFLLGSTGQLYTVSIAGLADSATTVAATAVGAGPIFSPGATRCGIDFNPVLDRVHIVCNDDSNRSANPNDGSASPNTTLSTGAAGAFDIVEAASTNSFGSEGTVGNTTLYTIDSTGDRLMRQGSDPGTVSNPGNPNFGVQTAIGALGVDTGNDVGFDIDGIGNGAVAALSPAGASRSSFYNINLNTGLATVVAQIGPPGTGFVVGLAIPAPSQPDVYAISGSNMVTFNPLTPGTFTSSNPVRVNGAGASIANTIIALDFRPGAGGLYAITTGGNIYTLASNGNATLVGTSTIVPNGTQFGLDFNPVADAMRLVSETFQNLRIDPDAATATADSNLNSHGNNPNGSITGIAYSNNFAGATSTTLYGIENTSIDQLVLIGGDPAGTPPGGGCQAAVADETSPNCGDVTDTNNEPGLFANPTNGLTFNSATSFDIVGGRNGLALAALTTSLDGDALYQIDLITGAATLIGALQQPVTAMTIRLDPP